MDIQEYIQSGIIESYVLGLASAEESAEVEKLSLQYPDVKQAINEFSVLFEQQAFENAVTPPQDVKGTIMAAIREEAKGAPLVSLPENGKAFTDIPSKSFRLWKMVAAASVILLVISTALNFYFYNQYRDRNNAYQALLSERNTLQASNQLYQTHLREWQNAAEMMADTAMIMIKMPGIAGKKQHEATVFWNTKNKDVYVMPNKLPNPGSGKQFQLWALVDGKPVDAGVLDPGCTGVCKMKNIPRAQAFAITLENQGGSPTPTMQQMYVLGKVG